MRGWNRRSAVWAAVATVVLLAGIASGALVSRLFTNPPSRPVAQQTVTQPSAAPGVTPAPDSWWKPLPAAVSAFVPVQIVIERLHVLAPIEVKGVDSRNTMESPDKPTDVAWYTFTAKPGAGGNAVFAGHRDFGRVGNPAVFWDLDKLVAGDLIHVVSDQRTEIRYRVTRTWDYPLNTIPMADVLALDTNDEITLITTAGTYAQGGYDHRYVVRALKTTV